MGALWIALGVVLIVLVYRDIFHTLFHPDGSGSISGRTGRIVWRVFRTTVPDRPPLLVLAGPIALLLIILVWTVTVMVGWALIFWPFLPDGFLLSTGMDPERNSGFLDAVYLSLVTLATLGYGDIAPQGTWLRIVAPLEALTGFALITASISWILSVYPVIARRRHLARTATLFLDGVRRGGLDPTGMDERMLADRLWRFTEDVLAVRGDLVQFPITYYFHTSERESAIEPVLPAIASFAHTLAQGGPATVQFHAQLLLDAIDDLATYVADTFLDDAEGDTMDLLLASAGNHLYPVKRDDGKAHSD